MQRPAGRKADGSSTRTAPVDFVPDPRAAGASEAAAHMAASSAVRYVTVSVMEAPPPCVLPFRSFGEDRRHHDQGMNLRRPHAGA
jgi:hypothetical protein